MSTRKSWNDRNQRNYERYFKDGSNSSQTTGRPNFNSSRPIQTSSGNRRNYDTPPSYNTSRTSGSLTRSSRRKLTGISIGIAAVVLVASGIVSFTRMRFGGNSDANYANVTNNGNIISDVKYSSAEKSYSTCIGAPSSIPAYNGRDYVTINDGVPNFTQWDFENIRNQKFSALDKLGRCGTAVAMLDRSMMPTENRGEIGQVKPTGWVQNKYEGIIDSDPPYLYNRSHLIAYALTGENANELNLITGTRYMNATVMLSWEEKVMQYLDYSPNHVLYRVTPYFEGRNMLATGVEMEAYSVEDNGEGICFHVFIYNVQPGIGIDYSTGDNWEE